MSKHDPVQWLYIYAEHKGQRYRVEIEIRTNDMALWLVQRAMSNRTKQARTAFAKAKARAIKGEQNVG